MKNYINVRVQSYNYTKQFNLLRHNFRHTKDSLSQINDKSNFMVGENKLMEITNQNKKRLYDVISEKYKQDRIKHNELYKRRHKRNLRDFQATWTDGILTFSEAIHSDLGTKYSKEDLSKIALNCAYDIAKKYHSELIYLTLHMDETTPHFHFALQNFDQNGLSLWKKNQNKEFLSKLQDVAFEHFKVLGMDRGISKDITGKRYETIQKYHIRKEMELRDKVSNTQAQYDKLQKEVEKSLKALYTEVNLQKNEVKDLRSTYDRTTQEYKNLTIIFKQLQDEEKTLREKVRELKEIDNLDNYLKLLKNDIKNILEKNTKQVNSFVGSSRIEIENITQMYKELVSKISEPLNSKIKEIETLKEENSKLKQEIAKKETRINELIVEKNKLNDTNSVLTNNNTKIKDDNKKLIEMINSQQEVFKDIGMKLKRQNQKLRDRTKYLKKILKDQNIKITRDQIRLTLNKPKLKQKIEKEFNFER
ncbi:plasmid recombination protein [Aliarcobacter butzleri]|uniref:plasmid recombination protein n=1 Tax=Aliarcobacter butzleri TaxID=28197 RepID=UPI0024DE7B39|nr:plasmid recombination protein [Aliarcobacter butzleri]MDK2064987.1 plasmid recombination protein [Aliarcobacter butzleri]